MTKLYIIGCLVIGLIVGFSLMTLFKSMGATFITIGDVIATYFFSLLFTYGGALALILYRSNK